MTVINDNFYGDSGSAVVSGNTPAPGSVRDVHIASDAAIAQSKIANLEADLDAKQDENSRLTTIATASNPATVKLFQLETDGSITLVDPSAGTGSGEANTGSNIGASGAGVFAGKSGVDLQFRKLSAGSDRLTIVEGADQITLDVVSAEIKSELNLTFSDIGGTIGDGQIPATITRDTELAAGLAAKQDTIPYTPADDDDLTAHIGNTSNPHSVTASQVGAYTTSQTDTLLSGKAAAVHGHAIGDVTGLQTALDGKATASHSHSIANVTGLQTALDGKASSSHSHAISDVTGLQTALNGKEAVGVAQTIANGLLVISGTAPTSPGVGQRWLDTSDRIVWYWNGTYWLSDTLYFGAASFNLLTTTQGLGIIAVPAGAYDILIQDFTFSMVFNSPQNGTDFWRIQLERQNAAGNQTVVATTDVSGLSHAAGLTGYRQQVSVNVHQDVSALSNIGWRVACYRQGAAGGINQPSFVMSYRLAKP